MLAVSSLPAESFLFFSFRYHHTVKMYVSSAPTYECFHLADHTLKCTLRVTLFASLTVYPKVQIVLFAFDCPSCSLCDLC